MSFRTISAILKSTWLIDHEWAAAHFPLVSGIIDGKFQLDAMKPSKGEMSMPFIVLPNGKNIGLFEERLTEYGMSVDVNQTNSKAQPGSIAVIPVIGPILKYDGECGEAGSLTRGDWFKKADADENIIAIIGYIDSPGGQVDGTATLADTIKSLTKPTIAVIDDGMMASAAMWIGSAFSEIYATQPTDSAGSIGVFCSFLDVQGWYEKQGVKVHTVYAPESSEKNIEFREAMKGKYALMEADLSFIAQTFHDVIKTNRGDRLTTDKWNKGGMYFASEAIEIGLIDGIKSFDEVVSIARNAAEAPADSSVKSQQLKTSSDMKFPKIAAFVKMAASELTPEMVAQANTELAESEVEGVSLVMDSEQEALVEAAGRTTTAEANAATLKTENEALVAQVAELKGKLNKPAEESSAPASAKDEIANTGGEPAFNVTSVDAEKAKMNADWK